MNDKKTKVDCSIIDCQPPAILHCMNCGENRAIKTKPVKVVKTRKFWPFNFKR